VSPCPSGEPYIHQSISSWIRPSVASASLLAYHNFSLLFGIQNSMTRRVL
jgi:hypothetical protein